MKRKNRKLTRISRLKKGSHKHGRMRRKKPVRAEEGCK